MSAELTKVSIHSPRRSEGRPWMHRPEGWKRRVFQSTPPAEARGDASFSSTSPLSMFQSTPPAEARGDVKVLVPFEVSIHSPRRSEGRQKCGCLHCRPTRGFNPLPPPKRGETARRARRFNPLPPPKRGETAVPHSVLQEFQSTPPAEARGDLERLTITTLLSSGFNPLPPPKRGET